MFLNWKFRCRTTIRCVVELEFKATKPAFSFWCKFREFRVFWEVAEFLYLNFCVYSFLFWVLRAIDCLFSTEVDVVL